VTRARWWKLVMYGGIWLDFCT
jgi:hypothetical protein